MSVALPDADCSADKTRRAIGEGIDGVELRNEALDARIVQGRDQTADVDLGDMPVHPIDFTSRGVCEAAKVEVFALPIDSILPDIVASSRRTPNLVIEAPPGAGKTTRVPPALLELVRDGQIVVLEPRRIAARLAARRVAAERGERVGESVGYQVRFEEVTSDRTRIPFVTEGVLNRRLLADPQLRGVAAVVLDEFHERHLDTDLALTLLRRLQLTSRPDLKLVVMSATLEADPVARYLFDCPILRSEGRLFELTVTYTPDSAAALEERVAAAFERLMAEGDRGDVLVFLPGAADIRKAARTCESIARRHGRLILPLHGDLPPAEQDLAVGPSSQPKLILSTNVAESSITIDGVTAVIDSGLARMASDSPWTGLPKLQVARISKAPATQRAGRAARTAPGKAIRLYTAEDFRRRPDHETPEIARRELSQVCLDLRTLGVGNPLELAWLTRRRSLRFAPRGAPGTAGRSGPAAARMAQYPLHPRLSKLVLEGVARGVGDDACGVAAWLSSGARGEAADVVALLDSEWDPRTRQVYEQIRRIVRPRRQTNRDLDPLLEAILTAFPDRVGRKRRDNLAILASGSGAQLTDPAHTAEFFVALDIEDRAENALPLIRLTSAIEPEWLLDLFPTGFRSAVPWNGTGPRNEWNRPARFCTIS